MSKPNGRYRKIVLSDDINNETASNLIKAIIEINEDDDYKEEDYKDWVREPILLFINSFGGSVYNGLACVDIIQQSKTPVHTISIGSSMSMGLWIYLAGHKRFIGKNSTLMYHDVTKFVQDKLEGLDQELNEGRRLSKMYCDIITSTSSVKQEILDDYIERKAEWYIPAARAIELGLADGYYE